MIDVCGSMGIGILIIVVINVVSYGEIIRLMLFCLKNVFINDVE